MPKKSLTYEKDVKSDKVHTCSIFSKGVGCSIKKLIRAQIWWIWQGITMAEKFFFYKT